MLLPSSALSFSPLLLLSLLKTGLSSHISKLLFTFSPTTTEPSDTDAPTIGDAARIGCGKDNGVVARVTGALSEPDMGEEAEST